MSQLMSLVVIAALLLIPLVPAAVLYKVLTPKRRSTRSTAQRPDEESRTTGRFDFDGFSFGKAQLKFNVVGSTATYVVLLAVSIGVYLYLSYLADKRAERIASSMRDDQAWIVEAPIGLQDENGQPLVTDGREVPQIRVDLEPASMAASATAVTFRVITTNGKFPTARFSLPGIGQKSVVLDLNNSTKVRSDSDKRRLTSIEPVWIVLGPAYGTQQASTINGTAPVSPSGPNPSPPTTINPAPATSTASSQVATTALAALESAR